VSSIVYNVNIFFNEFDEVVMCLQGSVLKDLYQGPQNRNFMTQHYVFSAVYLFLVLTPHTLW
jgi:hypothetical protein